MLKSHNTTNDQEHIKEEVNI